ncbi:hypothetical protein RRG08_056705 [Elysia crispata]|uniref:Uncharacterized protein n=1 Tax=Elysia crispata TaxID=231223 RepID=A0AAE1AVZ3_9GAST|nr:hypothetical protein RRG08_056705 [Elysia crispata]
MVVVMMLNEDNNEYWFDSDVKDDDNNKTEEYYEIENYDRTGFSDHIDKTRVLEQQTSVFRITYASHLIQSTKTKFLILTLIYSIGAVVTDQSRAVGCVQPSPEAFTTDQRSACQRAHVPVGWEPGARLTNF